MSFIGIIKVCSCVCRSSCHHVSEAGQRTAGWTYFGGKNTYR